MLFRIVEPILLPIAWAAIVLGALQSRFLISSTNHAICGPWGCGPESGALLAMHAGWLAFICPPLIYMPLRLKLSQRAIRKLSVGLFLAGFVGVLVIVAKQWIIWLPQSGAWAREYIWQRCGFAVVVEVDWPFIPLLVVSGILEIVAGFRMRTIRKTL
jgi:hypothetical protein